jgi:hypothetical protein
MPEEDRPWSRAVVGKCARFAVAAEKLPAMRMAFKEQQMCGIIAMATLGRFCI